MSEIPLTDAERLILANQMEILSILKKDPELEDRSEALRHGYEWLYRNYTTAAISPNMNDDRAQLVIDILKVYQALQNSKPAAEDESVSEFPGFDANNESDLFFFAEALDKSRRFSHVRGNTNNSHSENESRYRNMIKLWKFLGSPDKIKSHDRQKFFQIIN